MKGQLSGKEDEGKELVEVVERLKEQLRRTVHLLQQGARLTCRKQAQKERKGSKLEETIELFVFSNGSILR